MVKTVIEWMVRIAAFRIKQPKWGKPISFDEINRNRTTDSTHLQFPIHYYCTPLGGLTASCMIETNCHLRSQTLHKTMSKSTTSEFDRTNTIYMRTGTVPCNL